MLPSQIDEYTLRDIELAYVGYLNDSELRKRHEWEVARMLAFYTLAPHSKKKISPTDIFKFEDERKATLDKLKRLKDDPRFPKRLK